MSDLIDQFSDFDNRGVSRRDGVTFEFEAGVEEGKIVVDEGGRVFDGELGFLGEGFLAFVLFVDYLGYHTPHIFIRCVGDQFRPRNTLRIPRPGGRQHSICAFQRWRLILSTIVHRPLQTLELCLQKPQKLDFCFDPVKFYLFLRFLIEQLFEHFFVNI